MDGAVKLTGHYIKVEYIFFLSFFQILAFVHNFNLDPKGFYSKLIMRLELCTYLSKIPYFNLKEF